MERVNGQLSRREWAGWRSALVVATLAAGCLGPRPLVPSEVLPGTTWRLVAMDGIPRSGPSVPTLAFDAQGLSGDTGCNRYFAEALLDGSDLELGPIGVTRRACAPELMDVEARFLELLAGADELRVDPEFLVVEVEGARHPLRFWRQPGP